MRAVAIVAFPLLILVFWAFGNRVARRLGLRSGSRSAEFGIAIALSYGTITLLTFLLAIFHAVTVVSVLATIATLAAVAAGDLREKAALSISGLREFRWRSLFPSRSELRGWLASFTILFYLLGFIMALAPPTGIDAGVYHFTIPKVILQERGLIPRDDIWIHKFGGFYMVYVAGMALGGEILAKLLAFGAAAAAGVLAFAGAERLRAGAGWMAAFILSSTPLFAGFVGYENLEPPIVMYLVAAAVSLFLYDGPGTSRWLLAACAFSGLAAGTKPNAFPVAVVLPAGAVLAILRERRGAAPVLAGGVVLFLITAGFWGAWNLMTTGTIVYQYPGTALDQIPSAPSSWTWVAGGVFSMLGYLCTVGTYWTESAGPFIIAGIAGSAIFLWKRCSRLPLALFASSILVYIAVLAALSPGHLWTSFGARYVAPASVGFGVFVAAPFASWACEQRRFFRAAVVAALLLPAVPLAFLKGGKAAVAAPAALGIESRSSYLAKKIETFVACETLNRLPDPNVRVLFVAYRPYYLDRPFIHAVQPESPFYRGLRGRDDFIRRARELAVTHVLYEPSAPQTPWMSDVDAFFGAPPFREVGRWPTWGNRWVRLYELPAK